MSNELKITDTRFVGSSSGGIWFRGQGAAVGVGFNTGSAITTRTGWNSDNTGTYGNSGDTDLDKFFEDAKKARDDACLEKLQSIEEKILAIKEFREQPHTIYSME